MSVGVVDLFNQLAQNDFGFFQRIGSVADLMTRKVTTLTLDDTFEDAALLFRRNSFHHAPVIDPDEGDVVGIVSDRDVLRHCPPLLGSAAEPDKNHPTLQTSVMQFMTRAVVAVSADAAPEVALTLMLEHHIDSVLVQDEQRKIQGILTARDFMKMVLLFHRVCTSTPDLVRLRLVDLDMSRGLPLDLIFSRGARSVRDVMTREVECIGPKDRVARAVEIMQSLEVRHLPVVDDARHVVGMVSDRDILKSLQFPVARQSKTTASRFREELFATQDESTLYERVSSIMTKNPETVRPDTLFVDAIKVMLDRGFSGFPVLDKDDGSICGIFTMTDVLRVLRVAFQIGLLVDSGGASPAR